MENVISIVPYEKERFRKFTFDHLPNHMDHVERHIGRYNGGEVY